jgi:hypothetical protein
VAWLLGAAFATYGGYQDSVAAIAGLHAAFVVGATASIAGVLAALFAPSRAQLQRGRARPAHAATAGGPPGR